MCDVQPSFDGWLLSIVSHGKVKNKRKCKARLITIQKQTHPSAAFAIDHSNLVRASRTIAAPYQAGMAVLQKEKRDQGKSCTCRKYFFYFLLKQRKWCNWLFFFIYWNLGGRSFLFNPQAVWVWCHHDGTPTTGDIIIVRQDTTPQNAC